MWIKSFRIHNYKSFDDSGPQVLDRRINVVVGQNHSGKTALLQAIAQRATGTSHRSSRFRRGEPTNPTTTIEFEFAASGQEVRDAILSEGMNLYMPIPQDWIIGAQTKDVLDRIFSLPEIIFAIYFHASAGSSLKAELGEYPSVRFPAGTDVRSYISFMPTSNRADFHVVKIAHGDNDNVSTHFAPLLTSRTYYFNAQRIPQNDFEFGNSKRLSSDAANLAQLLNILQSNRSEFAQYVAQVRRVIPLIKWINVVPSTQRDKHVEIKIWNVEESTGRDDLAIPLAECGTGVGQVLSILYVVQKLENNIVLIDEPNSFLHPSAARALVGILREDDRNQYVISTHSPEIIAASDPGRLFMLELTNEKTNIRKIERNDLISARQVLAEIGSRMSDVFGADGVLWVEGPTEVECFPLLLKSSRKQMAVGLAIAALRNTGDLEGRHAEAVADIYRNISAAHTIVPVALAVSLDGDKQDISGKETLKRAFGDVLRFLPRRTYENYLLNPAAICAVLNALPGFQGRAVTVDEIAGWLAVHGRDEKFKASADTPHSPAWLVSVDAPRLLDALFQGLSDAREIYRKPLHAVQLTKWILANDPASIQGLTEYVLGLVPTETLQ